MLASLRATLLLLALARACAYTPTAAAAAPLRRCSAASSALRVAASPVMDEDADFSVEFNAPAAQPSAAPAVRAPATAGRRARASRR